MIFRINIYTAMGSSSGIKATDHVGHAISGSDVVLDEIVVPESENIPAWRFAYGVLVLRRELVGKCALYSSKRWCERGEVGMRAQTDSKDAENNESSATAHQTTVMFGRVLISQSKLPVYGNLVLLVSGRWYYFIISRAFLFYANLASLSLDSCLFWYSRLIWRRGCWKLTVRFAQYGGSSPVGLAEGCRTFGQKFRSRYYFK